MWYGLFKSPAIDPDLAAAMRELLLSTTRRLVLLLGGIYLLLQLFIVR